MSRSLVIYGAGGHGLVVAEAAEAAGRRIVGFLDDRVEAGSPVGPWHVIAPSILDEDAPALEVIAAVGDNAARQALHERLVQAGHQPASVIHPTAWVSPSAVLGQGVYVGARAVVSAQARIGDGAIINTAAIVEHHGRIDAFSHIAVGAVLSGHVHVGHGTLIGTGASVRPGIRIGAAVIVGVGAAVVENVPDGVTVMGVPARPGR